jgi:hypothetical protein
MNLQQSFVRWGHSRPSRAVIVVVGVALTLAQTGHALAAIAWDGGGNSNWWFDPVNWSDANGYLPPYQSADGLNNPYPAANDAQINNGWNVAGGGEGVVYDPVNDPFYPAVASATYFSAPFDVLKGQVLNRFYISRNTTNTNQLTIKSGSITFATRLADPSAPIIGTTNYQNSQTPTIIIGRSGSTATAANQGRVVQLGGTFSTGDTSVTLDIGQREAPTATNPANWGNGTWDYRGGTLLVQQGNAGSQGIRLSAGSATNGTGGVGKFIMRNPTTGGKVKTFDFTFCADGNNGDGVLTGVGIAEFHFANGGTRPIQIDRNLTINNGLDADLTGIRSARLDLKLDAAPTLVAGVPQDLGLFDVNFGNAFGGTIGGVGDADGNGTPSEDTDQVFWDVAGTTLLGEGATVSAIFGSTKYNWTITYTGDIQWTDADNSVVSTITGPTTGTDVVLIGLSSETVQVDDADFDGDGDVDGRDFLIWQRGVGVGTTLAQGDANGSGSVNGADLAIWKTQFGQAAVGAAGAIPEPGSAVLLIIGAASVAALRRRR